MSDPSESPRGTESDGGAGYSSLGGRDPAKWKGHGWGIRSSTQCVRVWGKDQRVVSDNIINTYSNREAQGVLGVQKAHSVFHLILKLFIEKLMRGHIPFMAKNFSYMLHFYIFHSSWSNASHRTGT
jgi:hypothetical protein